MHDGAAARGGFSLVEIVIALMILAFGLLAMAATTGYVSTQVRVADLTTERTLARQAVVERLRALPFDSVDSRTSDDAWTVGDYRLWWDVALQNVNLKQVSLVAEGPGHDATGTMVEAVRDTTVLSVLREYSR